jgi:hypothetical protein
MDISCAGELRESSAMGERRSGDVADSRNNDHGKQSRAPWERRSRAGAGTGASPTSSQQALGQGNRDGKGTPLVLHAMAELEPGSSRGAGRTGTEVSRSRAEVRARRHGEQQERPWRWELGRREEQSRGAHQGAERTGWTEGDAAKSARNPAMDGGIKGGGTAGEERSREGASWADAMREAGERDGRESPTAGG